MAQYVWDSKNKKLIPKAEADRLKTEQDLFPAPATETKKPPGRPKKIEQEQGEESGS